MTEKLQNKDTKLLWKRILVPVSFAPSSEKALRAAFDIAREKKIDLIMLRRHRETALEHFFIGRNIDRVVGHADCAVESDLQAVKLL